MSDISIKFNIISKNKMVSLALYDVPVADRDYDWWDARARDPHPLTEDEEEVIYGCGGLFYLRSYLKQRGPIAASMRSVSEKHYLMCKLGCICGRHPIPEDKIERDYMWWEDRARNPKPLTPEEEKIIFACGGLSSLRDYAEINGFDKVWSRTVSERCFLECKPGCICGRNKFCESDFSDSDF